MYYINIINKHWLSLTVGKSEDFEDAERYVELYKSVASPEHVWIASEKRYIRREEEDA